MLSRRILVTIRNIKLRKTQASREAPYPIYIIKGKLNQPVTTRPTGLATNLTKIHNRTHITKLYLYTDRGSVTWIAPSIFPVDFVQYGVADARSKLVGPAVDRGYIDRCPPVRLEVAPEITNSIRHIM